VSQEPHIVFHPVWSAALEHDRVTGVQRWLSDRDSLTRHLIHLSGERFTVVPLCEAWQTLRDDECIALQLPAASLGWVREVLLCGAEQPWVFARSVAGRLPLQNAGLELAQLGTRSLGEILFSDPAFVRRPLEVCRYPGRWLPHSCAHEGLWARRSRFDRDALGILVAEVFLPDFWLVALPSSDNC